MSTSRVKYPRVAVRPALRVTMFCSLALLLSACAGVRQTDTGKKPLLDRIELLQQLLLTPEEPTLLRDLGIYYFQSQLYDSARTYLYRSYVLVHNDPRTLFFYGMTLEYLRDEESALRVYFNYSEVATDSPYRKLTEGRYRALTHELIKRQVQQLLAQEKTLGTERVSPKAVAVFPLIYQGTDAKYEALGKGLSEMLLIDLGQVKSLTVVERIRIESLLQELQFSQSDKVERETAPRMGKLLSAGRIVSGTFNVNEFVLRADVATWDVVNKRFPDLKTESDELNNLFKMQKEMVFRIIRDLGITLTQDERDKILLVPTKSVFAFMNYCYGLKSEGRLDYREARAYYSEAARLDPGFELAKSKALSMAALGVAGESKEKALAAAEQIEPGLRILRRKARTNLTLDRLYHLGFGIGSTFKPGQDDRKPLEEALGIGKLPEPPRPPGN